MSSRLIDWESFVLDGTGGTSGEILCVVVVVAVVVVVVVRSEGSLTGAGDDGLFRFAGNILFCNFFFPLL